MLKSFLAFFLAIILVSPVNAQGVQGVKPFYPVAEEKPVLTAEQVAFKKKIATIILAQDEIYFVGHYSREVLYPKKAGYHNFTSKYICYKELQGPPLEINEYGNIVAVFEHRKGFNDCPDIKIVIDPDNLAMSFYERLPLQFWSGPYSRKITSAIKE